MSVHRRQEEARRREELKRIRTAQKPPKPPSPPKPKPKPPSSSKQRKREELKEIRFAQAPPPTQVSTIGEAQKAKYYFEGAAQESKRQLDRATQYIQQAETVKTNLTATLNKIEHYPRNIQILNPDTGEYGKITGRDIERVKSKLKELEDYISDTEKAMLLSEGNISKFKDMADTIIQDFKETKGKALREQRARRERVRTYEYTVTWTENGKEKTESFTSKKKAEAFKASLTKKKGEVKRTQFKSTNLTWLKNFISEDIDDPKKANEIYKTIAPYHIKSSEQIQGAFEKALEDVWKWSMKRYDKANYPTQEEKQLWYQSATPYELIGAPPWKPKNYEELTERLGFGVAQGLLGVVDDIMFPMTVTPRPTKEEEVWARMAGALITISPTDIAISKFINKAYSSLKARRALKKVLEQGALTNAERKLLTTTWNDVIDDIGVIPASSKYKTAEEAVEGRVRASILSLFGEKDPVLTASEYAKWYDNLYGKLPRNEAERAMREYAKMKLGGLDALYNLDPEYLDLTPLTSEEFKKLAKNAQELMKFWEENPQFFTTGAAYTPIQVLNYKEMLEDPVTRQALELVLSDPGLQTLLPASFLTSLAELTKIQISKSSTIPDIVVELKKLGFTNAQITRLSPYIIPIPGLDLDLLAKSMPKLSDETLQLIIPKLDSKTILDLEKKLTEEQKERLGQIVTITPALITPPELPPLGPPPEEEKLKPIIPKAKGVKEKKRKLPPGEESYTVKFTDYGGISETHNVSAKGFHEAYMKAYRARRRRTLLLEVDIRRRGG